MLETRRRGRDSVPYALSSRPGGGRLVDAGWPVGGTLDHGAHEAIYLHDPDRNGMELAWDRHPSEWPRRNGNPTFTRSPLGLDGLLAELEEPPPR